MPGKTPSVVSAVLTVIFLLLIGLVLTFGQLVMLNGFSEREGTASFISAFVCQGAGLILCAALAGWLTKLFVQKFNWNKVLAVVAAVFISTILGSGLAFVSLIVSLGVAETMR